MKTITLFITLIFSTFIISAQETAMLTFTGKAEKNSLLPLVQTLSVDRASSGSAQVSSKVTAQDKTPITEVGIIVSTDSLFSKKKLIFKGDAIAPDGTFICQAYKLTKGFKYVKLYVRAYAINKAGTTYGNVLSFLLNNDFRCGDLLYDIDDNV